MSAESAPQRQPIHRRLLDAWMAIAVRFGEVQTLVLLAIFYALLLGPASLVSRLARRDMLGKRGLREPGSAWREADTAGADLDRSRLQS